MIKITNDSQWRLGVIAEYTCKCMPQRNQVAELGFADVEGKARDMIVKTCLPEEIWYKLCNECFNCAIYLSNLAVMTLNGKAASMYEHFHEANPCYAKHLRIWGEAGTVLQGGNGKVGNRGTPRIFIHYAKNHAGDCYHIYNPITRHMAVMRDVMWLCCVHYGKPEDRDKVVVYPQVVLLFEPEDAEARESVTLNASEPKVKSKDDEQE